MIAAFRRWTHVLLALVAIGLAGTAQQAAARDPGAPRFSLRWEVTGVDRDAKAQTVTHARLTLRNMGNEPLAPGWTLWFTAIGESETANSAFPVQRITGSLFRLAPKEGLPPLAPGQAISFAINHPGEVLRDDKGPTGPYVVRAGEPDRGIAIADYAVLGVRRSTPGAPADRFTDPAATFEENRAWQAAEGEQLPPVLPSPKTWRIDAGPGFPATLAAPRISAGLGPAGDYARRLAAMLPGRAAALPFAVTTGPVPDELSPEAYRLTISPHGGVRLTGASPAGVQLGLATLEQLLFDARRKGGRLRALEITDAPRFPHRGLTLDVARNFRTVAEVKQVIDTMARFKLNVLHLHLTDDEGWRIAIPALPELTQVGARRGHAAVWNDRLPPAVGSGPDQDDPHGSGFYSGADYIELLRYAAARQIAVLPEIDMPGHARAAVKAMAAREAARPEEGPRFRLSDPADRSAYYSAQGYTDNAIDPGLASVDRFLEEVIGELVRLHKTAGVPLTRMHIGADEAPRGAWLGSPAASARAKALGGGDGAAGKAALWDDFFTRVMAILKRHGVGAVGWEELGMVPGAPSPAASPRFAGQDVTLQVWNTFEGSEGLGNRLANAGYGVVQSPASHLYLDMVHAPDPTEPGHDWVAPLPLSRVFGYDPERSEPKGPALTEAGRANIKGIEATLFSETVRGPWRLGHMTMPRLLAVAERAWAPRGDWAVTGDAAAAKQGEQAAWARFSRQLGEQVLPFVDAALSALAYRLPAPGLRIAAGKVEANYAWPGVTLRYTRDGTAPTLRSPRVTGPLDPGGTLTVAAFTTTGRASPASTIEPAP